MRRPPNDPIRKAAFREQARSLVWVDRERRKAKTVVDTAGKIASALERAYRYGFEDAQKKDPTWNGTVARGEDAIEWIAIPSRARREFESMAYGQSRKPKLDCYYIPAVTERGTPGWLHSWSGRTPGSTPLEKAKMVVSHQTMAILLRLGLVEFSDEGKQRIMLSQRGLSTWLKHCESGAR